MADAQVVKVENPTELLAVGRRHLAVKDFSAAVEALATACELLAKEHGDLGDQCAEAYLWYGKSLLGLSREESGVLGDGMPGGGNAEEEEDDDDDDQEENGEDQENGEAEPAENSEEAPKENGEAKKTGPEPESASKVEEPGSSKAQDTDEQPGTSNGDAHDESVANLDNEDDVDNLQLAWEMLDLSRNILNKRLSAGAGAAGAGAAGGGAARALLADALLALGEVALESETYDKAVTEMQSCLEIQKELYGSDDRRIAETHYQIGLANSLASNFEDAITHFKNAANILESRIKTLENPTAAANDATVKKYTSADPGYSVQGEIKELKELLPEIQEKIQDMMEYKAETMKRVRETLCSSNGGASNGSCSPSTAGASSGSGAASAHKPATNIAHLVKRKRKASETDEGSAPKKANT